MEEMEQDMQTSYSNAVLSQPNSNPNLRHLHNVETHFDCPQAFLSSDFQCRDDVSEYYYMFLNTVRRFGTNKSSMLSTGIGVGGQL